MISPLSAIGSLTLQGASATTPAVSSVATPSGPSFAQTLASAAADAVTTVQGGEAAAIQGVTGSMPTFKVVEQVMSAQRTLQEMISIRDKAVSAYQEISRMTI